MLESHISSVTRLKIDVVLEAGMPAPQVLELGLMADKFGIHTIWGSSFASRRDPLLTVAPLSAATERLRLGTLPTSPYEVHPLRIADSLLTLNELCRGRASVLVGGLGHSTSRVTGLQPERRLDSVRDCISILKGMSPDEPLNHEGKQYSLVDYLPEWAVSPAPRIYAGATGPNMLRLAAELADGTMMGDVPLSRMSEVNEYISQGLRNGSRHREEFEVNNFFAWHVKSDRASSLAEAKQGLIWRGFLQDWHMSTFLTEAECALVQANRESFLKAFLDRSAEIENVPSNIVDQLVENLTFAGDERVVDSVINRLAAYQEAGLDSVSLKIHGDPIPSLKLIGERIVPVFV